jgi:pilus assembly protein CpaE
MPPSISIVVIDSDVDSLENIVKYVNKLGSKVIIEGTAANFERGYELVHKKRPMVVIMEIKTGELDACIDNIQMVLSRFPHLSIFALCDDRSADTILKVMRAGAVEYLLKPASEVDLTSALQKIGRLWITKTEEGAEQGHIYAFYSPKGGVGVTTLAVNTATSIHNLTKKPTIVVDLDLIAGDVTTFLNMNPSYSISDVTMNTSRLDASFLQGVIARHESGIHVLAEPKRIEEGVSLASEDLVKVLSLLKTMFSYIIIDTETGLNNKTMTALKMADTIVLTTVLSLPGIKNIQRYMSYFENLNLKPKIMLVINRYLNKGEIKLEDAVKILKQAVKWSFPNKYEDAMKCLNKGVPLNAGIPKSELNESVKDFAKLLISKKQEGVKYANK